MYSDLTPEEKAVYDWQYRLCGEFKMAIWNAIMMSNGNDRENLALLFPVEVSGYRKYAEEPGWWLKVQQKSECPPPGPRWGSDKDNHVL